MRGIILFKTQYGSTEQYAQWLADDTGLPIRELDEVDPKDMLSYDFVVIGSNVKMGHLRATEWIQENWNWLQDKKILLFSVSGTSFAGSEIQKMMKRSLPEDIRDLFEHYPLPGRVDRDKLNLFDRLILTLVSNVTDDEAEKVRLETGYDYVDHDEIKNLRGAVEQLTQVTSATAEG